MVLMKKSVGEFRGTVKLIGGLGYSGLSIVRCA
jgi:hypothetical protein